MYSYSTGKASRTGISHERHGHPNEDRCAIFQGEGLVWMAVFDGVSQGGGGAMASSLAVESMQTVFDDTVDENIYQNGVAIMRLAQERILTESASHPEYGEMRTTGVIACIDTVNHSLIWFSIGDSAVFVCPKRKLPIKLTMEDSDIGELLSMGGITEAAASRATVGHELNRYLGMAVRPDDIQNYIRTGTRKLSKDDTVLCCSDGLYSKVTPKILKQQFRKSRSLDSLIKIARELGSEDDITVTCARPEEKANNHQAIYRIIVAFTFFAFALGFFCGVRYSLLRMKEIVPSTRLDIQDTFRTFAPIDTMLIKTDEEYERL